jgi:hypothetical protein
MALLYPVNSFVNTPTTGTNTSGAQVIAGGVSTTGNVYLVTDASGIQHIALEPSFLGFNGVPNKAITDPAAVTGNIF